MIATLAQVKTLIKISQSDTSQDDTIKFLMPIVEEEIHDICKNNFIRDIDLINELYNSSNTYSFENSTNKINDSGSTLDDYFIAGNTIKILNSLYNDGIYLIDTVDGAGSYLTIDTSYGQEFTDESATNDKWISIYKLEYPNALKFPYAQMINYRLSSDNLNINKGIKSEKIDDYAISYENSHNTIYGYPASIIKQLQPYRKYYES